MTVFQRGDHVLNRRTIEQQEASRGDVNGALGVVEGVGFTVTERGAFGSR